MYGIRDRVTGRLLEHTEVPPKYLKRHLYELVKVDEKEALGVGSVDSEVDFLFSRDALGDVLMLLPSLLSLKEMQPDKKVGLCTGEALVPLMERMPFLDGVWPTESLSELRAPTIIDLEGLVDFLPVSERKPRPQLFADLVARRTGVGVQVSETHFLPAIAQQLPVMGYSLGNRPHPWIALAPRSKSPMREWGGEQGLVRDAAFADATFFVFHHEPLPMFDRLPNVVNLSGQTTVLELVSWLSACDVGIVPDSGAMHILGYLRKPTVAIFGRVIPPENRVSHYPTVHAVTTPGEVAEFDAGSYREKPYCWETCCYDLQFGNCKTSAHYRWCMRNISVAQIQEAYDAIRE